MLKGRCFAVIVFLCFCFSLIKSCSCSLRTLRGNEMYGLLSEPDHSGVSIVVLNGKSQLKLLNKYSQDFVLLCIVFVFCFKDQFGAHIVSFLQNCLFDQGIFHQLLHFPKLTLILNHYKSMCHLLNYLAFHLCDSIKINWQNSQLSRILHKSHSLKQNLTLSLTRPLNSRN